MLKHRPTLRRLALPGILAVLFAVPVQAYADEASALAELQAIRASLSHADLDAQRRLEMVRLALPPDASEHLKREVAQTALRLRACTGAEGGAGVAPGSPAGAGVTPGRGPALGSPAARAPGNDRASPAGGSNWRPVAGAAWSQQQRFGAAALAALLAAAAAGGLFLMYRRAADRSERLRQLNRELEEQALRDPLTHLPNRRAFIDKMSARDTAHRRKNDGSDPTDCITVMNIDHLRVINERFGHDVGDAVLAEVGRRLDRVVRDTDMLLRWGGEEFMVFSPNAHPLQMRRMLERVMGAVGATPVQVEVHSIPVTISAGLACLPFANVPEEDFDWRAVVSLADKALHYAKQQGRNRAVAVVGLAATSVEGLPAIDASFASAVERGLVEVMEVAAPAPAKKTPAA